MANNPTNQETKPVGQWVEPNGTPIPLSQIGGNRALKRTLKRLIEGIQNPQPLAQLGGKLPKALLVYGPPGTGKTLFARVIASQSGLPMCVVKGSALDEQFVGVGAGRLRAVFEEAHARGKCIVFIDEIDAFARQRSTNNSGGQDQTLVELMTEMDGFFKSDIIFIAATNRKDVLDEALLTRFKLQIEVPLPDLAARNQIIAIHTRQMPLDSADLPVDMAALSVGLGGREIEAACNHAAEIALDRIKSAINLLVHNGMAESEAEGRVPRTVISSDFYEGVKVVRYGPRIDGYARCQDDDMLTLVHELGHFVATMAHRQMGYHRKCVYELSIERRTMALGWNLIFSDRDEVSQTEQGFLSDLVISMAGAAFQQVLFPNRSKDTGLSSDLKQASRVARQMVTKFFMGEENVVGPVSIEGYEISEQTKAAIDAQVKALSEKAWRAAVELGKEYKYSLFELMEEILRDGTVHRERLEELFARAFADANDRLTGSRSRSNCEFEFSSRMAQLLSREPVTFSNWYADDEDLDVAPMGHKAAATELDAVGRVLADYNARFTGEKTRHQMRFDFQLRETMVKSVKSIAEELEVVYNMNVQEFYFSEDEPWNFVVEVNATDSAVQQYLAVGKHHVRELKELIAIQRSADENLIDIVIAQRSLARKGLAKGITHLQFNFTSAEKLECSVSEIVQELECDYGLSIVDMRRVTRPQWSLILSVSADEAQVDRFLCESSFDVDLAA